MMTERIYECKIFTSSRLSEVTTRYAEWMTQQQRELLAFVATKVELDISRGVIIVFFQHEQPVANTGITQRLVEPAPPAQGPSPMYSEEGRPIVDARHYNINNRYVTARELAQRHGRSEMFASNGMLSRAYFAGVSDTLDAQADAASAIDAQPNVSYAAGYTDGYRAALAARRTTRGDK